MGRLLAGRRGDVVVTTTFSADPRPRGVDNGEDWGARGSRRYVRRAVEQSLRSLRTDWIDLYQFCRPDPETPIEETLSTLDDLVREGKVRYIGYSGFTGWRTAHAEWTARTRTGALRQCPERVQPAQPAGGGRSRSRIGGGSPDL